MKLDIRRGFTKTGISCEGKPLFIIKSTRFLSSEKIICHIDGSPAYSVKRDPHPLDRRDKYIFTNCDTKNEFFAWVDRDMCHNRTMTLYKYLVAGPVRLCIEAESFFGELCIEHTVLKRFNISINGKKCGSITSRMISCDEIDDPGLLSVLYVFSLYILSGEEYYRAADAI
ncbi:MAG: hypothetical protein J1G06_06360 [Oscillospiraceae bacterium]|nr:hypothetical protein [Oscillospiraceae bacterium]